MFFLFSLFEGDFHTFTTFSFLMDVISDRERWTTWWSQHDAVGRKRLTFALRRKAQGLSDWLRSFAALMLSNFSYAWEIVAPFFRSLAVAEWWGSIDRSTNMSKRLQTNKQTFRHGTQFCWAFLANAWGENEFLDVGARRRAGNV